MKLDQFINVMQDYPIKRYPRAAQFIVNQIAYESRQKAIKKIDEVFILRGRYVPSRVQFQRAPYTRTLSDIQSSMGALPTIDFMREQEEGFTIRPKKGRKVAIPTRESRISKSIKKKRRAIYRPSTLMKNLRKPSQYKGKTKKARIKKMLQTMAEKKDKRPAVVPYRNNPGIYILRNIRKKRIGGKDSYSFQLMKIYDLSRKQVKVKPNRWMQPTAKWAYSNMGAISETAWKRFLARL